MELAITKSIEGDRFAAQFKLEISGAEEMLVNRFHLWSSNLPMENGKPLELQNFTQGVTFVHADVNKAAEFEEAVLERFHTLEVECEKVAKFATGDSTIHMFTVESRL